MTEQTATQEQTALQQIPACYRQAVAEVKRDLVAAIEMGLETAVAYGVPAERARGHAHKALLQRWSEMRQLVDAPRASERDDYEAKLVQFLAMSSVLEDEGVMRA